MSLAATWIDLEILILTEVSQTERNIWYGLYAKSKKKKKMIQMNLFIKQKHRLREWIYGYQEERAGEG